MTTAPQRSSYPGRVPLTHRPELDGVRGVAIILVVFAHYEVPMFAGGGGTGVVLFFVLSGYLITSLLLGEHQRAGTIDLPRFLWRRARRLAPALGVLVIVVGGLRLASLQDSLLVTTYLGNWATAAGVSDLGVLRHTWSLATEEQFYVVMPLAVMAVGSTRRLRAVAIAGIVVVTTWRILALHHGYGQMRLEYSLDTRADALLVGVGLATLGRRRLRPFVPILAAIVMVGLTQRAAPFAQWIQLDLSLAAIASAGLVWHGATSSSPLLSHPALVWAGRRSYSLYLWHPVLVWAAFERYGPLSWGERAWLLPLTLLVTELSYRLIEQRLRAPSASQGASDGARRGALSVAPSTQRVGQPLQPWS